MLNNGSDHHQQHYQHYKAHQQWDDSPDADGPGPDAVPSLTTLGPPPSSQLLSSSLSSSSSPSPPPVFQPSPLPLVDDLRHLPLSPLSIHDSIWPSLPLSLLEDTQTDHRSLSTSTITSAIPDNRKKANEANIANHAPPPTATTPTSSQQTISTPTAATVGKINSCTICHGQKVKCDGKSTSNLSRLTALSNRSATTLSGMRPCGRCVKMDRASQCLSRSRGDKPVRTGRRTAASIAAAAAAAAAMAAATISTSNNDTPISPKVKEEVIHVSSAASNSSNRNKHARGNNDTSSSSPSTDLVVRSLSTSCVRSASRSPVRKRERTDVVTITNIDEALAQGNGTDDELPGVTPNYADIAKLLSQQSQSSSSYPGRRTVPFTTDMALDGAVSAPFAAPMPSSSSVNAAKWVQQLMTAIPRSVILTFDESSVTRTAMANLIPWLKSTFTEDFSKSRASATGSHEWLKRMAAQIPLRVCPACGRIRRSTSPLHIWFGFGFPHHRCCWMLIDVKSVAIASMSQLCSTISERSAC
jgi:hypothetical protein